MTILQTPTTRLLPEFFSFKNIGKLPPYLRVLACEPSSIEPCTLELSDAVSQAIPKGIQLLHQTIGGYFHQQETGAI